jgi:tetratricopeptide (TPR) repeat protein
MHNQANLAGPLVGRGTELRAAWGLLQRARTGRGQLLGLTGEAGIGKSRLVSEIAHLARRLGFGVHSGACRAYGVGVAYLVWQPIWRSLLGIDPSLAVVEQQAQLAARVASRDGGSHRRAPLLAPVVNVPMPDSDLTSSLDPQVRAELMHSLLLDQFRGYAAATPLMVVLEDCHWIDPASQTVLELLGRDVAEQAVLLVATSRPTDSTRPSFRPLAHLAHFTELRVQRLPVEEAERLVSERVRMHRRGLGEVPSGMVQRIVASAGGNPFHLEELVSFLFARTTDPGATDALADARLPDDVAQLVLARTDQLAGGEKTTIQVASVLGTRVPASWIWGCYPAASSLEQMMRHLERLAELDFLHLHRSGRDPTYEFRHAITREAVYQNLDPRWRARMHGRAARFVERTYPDRLPQLVNFLAHHYGQTRDASKQRQWFRAAAEAAKAAFATETAIGWYDRLVALTPSEQAGELLIELGDQLLVTAKWAEAEEAYNRALKIADSTGDRRVRAEANRGLGSVLSFTQPHGQALNHAVAQLRQAVTEFDLLQDGRGLVKALERLAWTSSQLGDLDEALAASERNLYLATESDDLVAISGALANMGVVQRLIGDHGEALRLLRQALRAATTAGFQPGIILAANDLAGVLFERGQHVESFDHFRQALSVALEIGDRRVTTLAIGNLGECYRRRGENDRALRCFAHALRLTVEIDDRTGMAIIAENLAATLAAQGRELEAEQLLVRAITLTRHLDAQYWLCESLYQYALLLDAAGRLREAERANREALEIAVEYHRGVELGAHVLSFRLRVALGRMERGTAMRELRNLRDAWVEPAEQAALLEALWELDPTQERLRREAAELYRMLYEDAPTIEHRRAYERLTTASLEAPPALPPLPKGISRDLPDLAEVRAQLDLAIGQLKRGLARSG